MGKILVLYIWILYIIYEYYIRILYIIYEYSNLHNRRARGFHRDISFYRLLSILLILFIYLRTWNQVDQFIIKITLIWFHKPICFDFMNQFDLILWINLIWFYELIWFDLMNQFEIISWINFFSILWTRSIWFDFVNLFDLVTLMLKWPPGSKANLSVFNF